MKNQVCSWRDMDAVRQILSATEKGDGTIYKVKRCFNKSNVRDWRIILEVADAAAKKGCAYAHLEHFQPSHAREIARYFRRKKKDLSSDEIQDEISDWVDRCEREELTVDQLREALLNPQTNGQMEDGCTVDDLETLVENGATFGTIYADPPWKYGNQATRSSTDKNYCTMTVEEIAALPVAKLAEKQCHLHLWTTNAFLFECPTILEAWGFEYKSVFVWVKPQIGIGNYWRVSHEFLVLGVRGKLRFRDRSLISWIHEARTEHSTKPHSVRRMIEKASPGPYLELFGRQIVDGWTVWGNQIKRSMFNKHVKDT